MKREEIEVVVRAAMEAPMQTLALLGGAYLLSRLARAYQPPASPVEVDSREDDDVDDELSGAATLLGVGVDASADEIRAALRAKLATGAVHPDHGGDGETAARFVAAKNLLIERLKEEG